jgi:protoporphyrinogen oxidase
VERVLALFPVGRDLVVVVGAGLSGLAAGYRLHQGGATVTVLESASGPGGRVQTERHGDYIIDTGPDTLTAGYVSYLGLVEDLGLGDRLVDTSAVIGVIRQGRVIDLDPAKLLRPPFTPALSMLGKLRLATGFIRLRKAIANVDSYDMSRSAALDDPDVSAHHFALRHFGRAFARRPPARVQHRTPGRSENLCGRRISTCRLLQSRLSERFEGPQDVDEATPRRNRFGLSAARC